MAGAAVLTAGGLRGSVLQSLIDALGSVQVTRPRRRVWPRLAGWLRSEGGEDTGTQERLLFQRAGVGGDTEVGMAIRDKGPRPSLSDLYHAHRLQLVRLAILLVDDQGTAEDVVQDAFTGLWRRYGDQPDGLEHPLGYLRTSVVNNARSVLRRRQTARKYVAPHQPDADSAEREAMLAAEHQEVLAALAKLPERQREVLVLRYWSDLSEADIAETLGISRGTVKSTASRAIDSLQRMMA